METPDDGLTTVPGNFPWRLRNDEPCRLPFRPIVILILLAATFIPRAWAASKWDVIWSDTLHYVAARDATLRGDKQAALAEFGINVYPVILCGLKSLSPDWESTGKWWSVLMTTLTVLPLWGWLRRMFDDRTALVACLCYAFHGKLIAVSPLMIRDPTFLFFAATVLYLVWRTASEAHLIRYLLAGLFLTLAIHTRIEGWLLCLPVVGWSIDRAWHVRARRGVVLVGSILCLLCVPATVVAVNLSWLRDQPHWELLRPGHQKIVEQLFARWLPTSIAPKAEAPTESKPITRPATAPAEASPVIVSPASAPHVVAPPSTVASTPRPNASAPLLTAATPASVSSAHWKPKAPNVWAMNFKFIERCGKALTWTGSVLLLIGLFAGWRTFFRAEHLVLAVMNWILLLMIRMRFAHFGLDIRYFLPIAVVSLPWMAIGFFQFVAWSAKALRLSTATPAPRRRTLFAGWALVVSWGLLTATLLMIDGPIGAERMMRQQAEVGCWIRARFGDDAAMAGNFEITSLTPYYSHSRVVQTFFWNECLSGPLPAAVANRTAAVVVLWPDETITADAPTAVAQRFVADHGYREVPDKDLPFDSGQPLVLERVSPAGK